MRCSSISTQLLKRKSSLTYCFLITAAINTRGRFCSDPAFTWEILIIDDGSKDNTAGLVQVRLSVPTLSVGFLVTRVTS